MRMKKIRSTAPKSPVGRILAADGVSIPPYLGYGITAYVCEAPDDFKRHEATESGLGGAVTCSDHIFLKIPLTATQRHIRAAVKDMLKYLSGRRVPVDESTRQSAGALLEEGREARANISDPSQRRRKLNGTLAQVAAILESGSDKTVGQLRGESRAPFASQTGAAALRKKRDRWIKRRDEKLKRRGFLEHDRNVKIKEELLALKDGKKSPFGRWAWDKQDPYVLTEATIRKIATHNR